MAIWNAPSLVSNFEKKACYAAFECSQMLKQMREFWISRGGTIQLFKMYSNKLQHHRFIQDLGYIWEKFFMVLGKSKYCKVYAGNMGSSTRFNYTVLGESVNIAARLEPLNKIYGTEIIVLKHCYKILLLRFPSLFTKQSKTSFLCDLLA